MRKFCLMAALAATANHLAFAQLQTINGTDQVSSGPAKLNSNFTWLQTTKLGVPAAYSSVATYNQGDQVTSGATVYVSLQGTNIGNTPANSPTWWSAVTMAPFSLGTTSQYFRGDLSLATFPTTWAWSNITGAPSFVVNPMTTGGDMIVGGIGGTPQRLANPGSGTYCLNWATATSAPTLIACPGAGGGLSSVGLTMPSWFSVSNSPLTVNGTIAVSAAGSQTSHQVIGTCGSATSFAPCALTAGDIPALSYVSSVGLSLPSIFTVTGSPVTSSGTLTGSLATQAANTFFAGPTTGSPAVPTFRLLVSADIPNNAANTTGTAANVTGIVAPANGGTGANNTVGAADHVLRSNGTSYVDSAIQAADVPTLNQNTTETAANLSGTPALPNGTTATTQTAGDSSAKLATDAFVASAITGMASITPTPLGNISGSVTLTRSTNIQQWTMTLTGNVTFASTITNAANGDVYYFDVCQNSTGGYAVTWPSGFGSAPVVDLTPNLCTNFHGTWNSLTSTFQLAGGPTTTETPFILVAPTRTVPTSGPYAPPPANTSIMLFDSGAAGTLKVINTAGNTHIAARTSHPSSDQLFSTDLGDYSTMNAATATALAATPSVCGSGQAAQGILANGNATGCFTPSGGGGGGSPGSTYFTAVNATGAGPNNSSTETSLIPTPNTGSTTLPANTWANGTVVIAQADGLYNTPASTSDTLTLKLYCGATVLANSGAVSVANVLGPSMTNQPWSARLQIGAAAANSLLVNGAVVFFASDSSGTVKGVNVNLPFVNTSGVSFTFSNTCALNLTATFSGATSGESIVGTTVQAYVGGAPVTSVFGQTGAVPNLSGDVTTSGSSVTTVGKINGGSMPASAGVLGTNSSSQPVTATAHGIEGTLVCSDTSGSGTAQSCSTSPTFTPAAGDTIVYKTTTSNTGDVTVNVNSSSAAHIRKWQGSSVLAAGDLVANTPTLLTYDGTYWEIYSIGNAPSGGGSSAFSAITGGTNTSAAMVVGSGASLSPSGTGTITSTGVQSGAGAPTGNCTVGQVYFNTSATAGQNLYFCTATNTWTQMSGGGSSTVTETVYIPFGAQYSTNANSASEPTGGGVGRDTGDVAGATPYMPAGSGFAYPGIVLPQTTTQVNYYYAVWMLPSNWTGTLNITLLGMAGSSTGNAALQVATACPGSGAAQPPTYNTVSGPGTMNLSTANRLGTLTFSGVNVTGCSSNSPIVIQFGRNAQSGNGDTLSGNMYLLGMQLQYQHT